MNDSRVGVSLLSNAYTRELVAFSSREFEDLAGTLCFV